MAVMSETDKRKHIVSSINENMFVEAGAGAGKTTLIVERIAAQIQSGIRPREIAAITYTNKAAEELRSRIQNKLLAVSSNAISAAALDEVDSMPISTIHSFCMNMLKERAFDSEIRMDAEVYDEKQLEEEMDIFFRICISSLNAKQTKILRNYGIDTAVGSSLFYKFKKLCSLPENAVVPYDSKAAANMTVDDSAAINKLYLDAINVLISTVNRVTNANIADLSGLSNAMKKPLYDKLSDGKITVLTKLKAIAKEKSVFKQKSNIISDKSVSEIVNLTYWNWVEANVVKFINDRNTAVNNFEISVAYPASQQFRARERTKFISNNELIAKAEKLIRENKAAREHFSAKFKCIYVDEFQDTDQLQASMIWNLTYDEAAKDLRPGALFVVGDPKQSIYGFSGADPQVYHEIKSKPEFAGHVYVLDNNYRSNNKIIDWVNSKFNMGGNFRNNSFAYSNMTVGVNPIAAPSANAIEGVYYCKYDEAAAVNGSPKSKKDGDTVAAENTAALIDELVKKQIQIADRYNEKYRPIRYSDFLVLFNKNKTIQKYAEALKKRGIPVNVTGKVVLSDSIPVKRFVMLYNYCVKHHRQPIAVAAAQIFFHDPNSISDEMTEKGKALIEAVRNRTKGMKDAFAVAQFLIRNPHFYLPSDKELNADTLLQIQEGLEQLLADMLIKCKGNRVEAAELFIKAAENGFEKNLPLIPANDGTSQGGAVRLMTAHKAKGLEGNIVIWTNRPADTPLDFSYRKYGKPVTFYADVSGDSVLNNEREKNLSSEQTRLEYVICTRAKEVFIVMDKMCGRKALLDNYGIENEPDINKVLAAAPAYAAPSVPVFDDYIPVGYEREYKDEQFSESYVTLNPSGFDNYNAVRSEENADEIISVSPEAEISERPKGAIFGIAMHRSYELLIKRWKNDFNMPSDELQKLMGKCISAAIMEASLTIGFDEAQAYVPELTRILNWFVNDENFTGMLKEASEIFTELSFSYYTDSKGSAEMIAELSEYKKDLSIGDKKIWINGIADLVLKMPDASIIVIDYKSDIDKDKKGAKFYEDIKLRYDGQLALYRHAMGKIFGVKPDTVKCFLCNIDAGFPNN